MLKVTQQTRAELRFEPPVPGLVGAPAPTFLGGPPHDLSRILAVSVSMGSGSPHRANLCGVQLLCTGTGPNAWQYENESDGSCPQHPTVRSKADMETDTENMV